MYTRWSYLGTTGALQKLQTAQPAAEVKETVVWVGTEISTQGAFKSAPLPNIPPTNTLKNGSISPSIHAPLNFRIYFKYAVLKHLIHLPALDWQNVVRYCHMTNMKNQRKSL